MVHRGLLYIGGGMQAGFFLEEAVREDRTVRCEIRRVLNIFAGEIMQGYQDRRRYSFPQSQNEDYLSGWRIVEKNSKN